VSASERGPLIEELRSATRAVHRALDDGLALLADTVTVERFTVERYVAFLQGLLLVVEPLEERLASDLESPPQRAAALRADLAELGAGDSQRTTPELPPLDGWAAALGASYVLEGSSLGGVVLAREIGRGLGLEGRALRYLTLYGERLGERWRSEVAALEAWGQTATLAERAECCKTAQAVFAAFTIALRTTSALPEVA
jgi:heme oxygenase (biliverdin-IX-beta and delta-forming)